MAAIAAGNLNPKPPDIKSFAQALSGNINKSFASSSSPSIELVPVSTFKGEPAIIFSKNQIEKLAQPLKFALVGKFPAGRPSLEAIRKVFATLNLKAEFHIGLLDARHVLIRLNCEVDYHRVWLKEQWNIYQYPMRMFKWTPNFSPDKECSIVPTWILFPGLPPHLFDRDALRSIARGVGKPLQVDASTASLARPSVARMCVEVDMTKPLVKRIWIGCEDEGFWQRVQYESELKYCKRCFKVGHDDKSCGILETNDQNVDNININIREPKLKERMVHKQRQDNNNKGQEQQQWVLVKHKKNKDGYNQDPNPPKDNGIQVQEGNTEVQIENHQFGGKVTEQGKDQNGKQQSEVNNNQDMMTQAEDHNIDGDQDRSIQIKNHIHIQDIQNCEEEDEDRSTHVEIQNSMKIGEGNSVGRAVQRNNPNTDQELIDRMGVTGQDIIARGSPRASSAMNNKSYKWELDNGYASDGKGGVDVERQGYSEFSLSLMKHQFFRGNNDDNQGGDNQGNQERDHSIDANNKEANRSSKKKNSVTATSRVLRSTTKSGSSQATSNTGSQ